MEQAIFGHTINAIIGEIDLRKGGNDEKYKTHLASPHPYLNLSQTELEKLMRKKLQNCKSSQLLLGHQWESMTQKEKIIQSTVLNRSNQKQFEINSKYVICADGAGSRSRKSMGIEMIGDEKIDEFNKYYEYLMNFTRSTTILRLAGCAGRLTNNVCIEPTH